MRDIFDKEEDKIVGMSFEDTIAGQGSLSPEGNEISSEHVQIKDGQPAHANSTFSPQSQKTSTRGKERSGNFGGMPPEKPK